MPSLGIVENRALVIIPEQSIWWRAPDLLPGVGVGPLRFGMTWNEVIEKLTGLDVPFEVRHNPQLGDSVQIGWGELEVEFEDPNPEDGRRRMNGVRADLSSARLAGDEPFAWTIEEAAERLGGSIDREHEENGLVWVRVEYSDTSSAALFFADRRLRSIHVSPRYDEEADEWIWPELN